MTAYDALDIDRVFDDAVTFLNRRMMEDERPSGHPWTGVVFDVIGHGPANHATIVAGHVSNALEAFVYQNRFLLHGDKRKADASLLQYFAWNATEGDVLGRLRNVMSQSAKLQWWIDAEFFGFRSGDNVLFVVNGKTWKQGAVIAGNLDLGKMDIAGRTPAYELVVVAESGLGTEASAYFVDSQDKIHDGGYFDSFVCQILPMVALLGSRKIE